MIAIITEEQKNLLLNELFSEDSYFNPIQDFDNNWVISEEEINFCSNEQFLWIKQLPLTEYNPKLKIDNILIN